MSNLKDLIHFFIACSCIFILQSCSVSKQINKQAHNILLQDSVINTGHIGISIFEPATNSYWYNYNADKYFVPASNVKLFTLYAGMKYLGDSLVGLRYEQRYNNLYLFGTADPTFLHPDFKYQPVYEFAKSKKDFIVSLVENRSYNLGDGVFSNYNKYRTYGKGWSWDDYNESYMPEKSFFPIYGNVVKFYLDSSLNLNVKPLYFNSYDWWDKEDEKKFNVNRSKEGNYFYVSGSRRNSGAISVPFRTDESYYPKKFETNIIAELLSDTVKYKITQATTGPQFKIVGWQDKNYFGIIHSQPTDSLFTPMMHNSDNFFAEQTLLMASNEHLGYMTDEAIIDTLLKSDMKDVPQQPRWVDGSGLSRYNLFTPHSFIYILNKMKNEFGMERLKTILPTGGEGTLKNYYNSDSSFIYAKTGSLSNQITLSGFLITKKNKLLCFSVLCNNAIGDGWKVRRAIESFLKNIREQY